MIGQLANTAQGISRDRVIPTKIQNQLGEWTGEWSALVEPGSWIVYAMINSPEQETYLVSVEKLEVMLTVEISFLACLRGVWFTGHIMDKL